MKKQYFYSLCTFVFIICFSFISKAQSITINGPDPVCAGFTYMYDIAPNPGSTYQWRTNNKGLINSFTDMDVSITWGMHGTGEVKVYEYDANGNLVDSGILSVTVLKTPAPKITTNSLVNCKLMGRADPSDPPQQDFDTSDCIQACSYSCVMYYAIGAMGSTFTWTVTGGTVQQDFNDSALICWNGPGNGSITVKETTSDGCEGSSSICIKIIESPIARLRALPDTTQTSITICDSADVIFWDLSTGNAQSPIVTWRWDFGDGTYSNAQASINAPMVHTYMTAGVYWAKLTVTNKCGCSTTDSLEITVVDAEHVEILCPRVVCEGDTTKYVASPACSTGVWSVVNGNGFFQTGATVDVAWNMPNGTGYGYVIYDATSCGGMCAETIVKVPVIEKNAQITGPSFVCPNSQYLYKMPQWPTTFYTWSVVSLGGTTLSLGTYTNEIIVNTGISETVFLICNYYNSLLQCGGVDTFTVNIRHEVTLDGPLKVCHKASATYTLNSAGGTIYYGDWILDGPSGTQTSTSTNSFTPTFNDVGDYVLTVTGPGFCPPDPLHIRVDDLPPIPDYINGPDTFCKGVPTKFEAGSPLDGTVFNWWVLNGTANAPSGVFSEITMNPLSAGPFEIHLWRESKDIPFCRSDTLIDTIYPPNVTLDITGNILPCVNSGYVYFSGYNSGETYKWTIVNELMGSVVSGQNTPSATILWNNATGTADIICEMRKCDIVYIDTLTVTIGGVPTSALTITSSPVCVNSQFNVSVSNASGVNFNFGDNNINYNTTDNMNYTYTDNFNGTRTVTAIVQLAGCAAETTLTAPITVDPAPFGTTTSHIYDCGIFSADLEYFPGAGVPAAASYQWYYNGTAAGTTNPLTISSYGWYWVVVTATNGCTWTSDSIPVLEICPCILATNTPHVPWSPTISIGPTSVTNCNQINMTANIPSSVPLTPGLISYNWKALTNAQYVTGWGGVSSTGATAFVNRAGSYLFEYEVAYRDTFGTLCAYKTTQWVLVPYMADYYVTHTCADSAGMRYTTIRNFSDRYTQLTFSEISIDGTVVTTAGIWNGYLSTGYHTIKLRIADATHDTCEVTGSYLVQWPNADFDWDRPISCEKEASVQFNNLSTGANPVLWDFGDGAQNKYAYASRVYDLASTPVYNVTLWIEDAWGCRDSITKQVTIVADSIKGDLSASPPSACQGTPIVLDYLPDPGTNQPALYTWYNQQDVIANTNYEPLTVYESGYYWAYVEDNMYGCYHNTNTQTVIVTKVPEAFITGDSLQCENVAYTLSGYAGSDPSITYTWLLSGTPIPGATGPTLTETKSSSGLYDYRLVVSVPTAGGGTCDDTSDVFTVNVNPLPAAPTPAFNITDCNTYEVELSVSPVNPGTYNWNNGLFGSPAYAYYGGSFQVTYTDLNGCQSQADMYVPEDPRTHLWVFPTGCFTICPQNAYTITGNYIWPFFFWDYTKVGVGSVWNGSGLMFDYLNLNVDAPGNFNLTLDNGYCTATSGDMIVDTSCEAGGHIKPGRPQENDVSWYGKGMQQWNNAPDAHVMINIVPNPAKNTTHINYVFNENSISRYIEVYDMAGRVLSKHSTDQLKGSWLLSLDRYTPGIYQVVLRQDGRVLLQSKMSVLR